LLEKRRRVAQPDVYGLISIQDTSRYPLKIDINEAEYLELMGLRDIDYVILHRGTDVNEDTKRCNKLWPVQYYAILLRILKQHYPNYQYVQLGVSTDRCPAMEGAGINLVGKTNMEQIKVLLKNARLLIDGEGGMPHLRHCLGGGRSVVLFGPTSKEFYGYPENINIQGDGCPHCCEWVTEGWMRNCPRGYNRPPCMLSIIPEMVVREIHNAGILR
jgi:ADP-heptose:LPS heptosyltransferase